MFGSITFFDKVRLLALDKKQLNPYASFYGNITTATYMFIANILLLNLLIAMFKYILYCIFSFKLKINDKHYCIYAFK